MKVQPRILRSLFLVLLGASLRVQAQVSFFEPPSYSGADQVFVADFNQDGQLDLLASDGTMNLGKGDGTFSAGTNVTISSGASVLAVADFNGDGKPDVLEQGTGTLLVLLGRGDGTFQSAISTANGASLSPIAAIDVNADGKADVVGIFNNSLLVYLGKSDGTFSSALSYNLDSSPVYVLSFGDFNRDNKTDIAVSAAAHEFVWLANGDGTFQGPTTSGGIYSPSYAAPGDFNGDGTMDLAVNGCDASSNCNTSILVGNGDGSFQPPATVFSGSGPLIAADLNADNKLDLVLQGDPSVSQTYLGNGDGTFTNASNYLLTFPPAAPTRVGLAIADFNGDGHPDAATGGVVLLGNGDGTFQGIPLCVVATSNIPGSQVIGDFDNNGVPDLALVANKQVSVLKNNGSGVLSLANTYIIQQPGYAIVTADFNGDGDLDLVVFGTDSTGNWNCSVLLGNGDGSFLSPVFSPQSVITNAQSYSVAVADFNADRRLDLAVTSGNQTLALLLGNGDGTFAAPSYLFDAGASAVMSGDFNSDGIPDIAAGTPTQTAILFGKGDGTFQAAVFPSSLSNYSGAQFAADLNNDSKVDLITTQVGYSQVALGNGNGTFSVLPSIGNQVNTIADLNGDGKADVIATQWYRAFRNQTGVMLGNGDGTFASLMNVPSRGLLPASVLVADMNGDDRPDLVFPWVTAVSGIAVMLNTKPNPAPDFSLDSAAGNSTAATISAGQTARYSLVIAPSSTFSGTVTLVCAVTPIVSPAPKCSLSTFSLQIVNGAAQAVAVTVETSAPTTATAAPSFAFPPTAMPLISTITIILLTCLWLTPRHRRYLMVRTAVLILASGLLSCSGAGNPSSAHTTIPGTPAGNYTATVTASSGTAHHSMGLTLVVQ